MNERGFNLQSLISFSVNIGISFDTTRRAYDGISHDDSFIDNLFSYNKRQIDWGGGGGWIFIESQGIRVKTADVAKSNNISQSEPTANYIGLKKNSDRLRKNWKKV